MSNTTEHCNEPNRPKDHIGSISMILKQRREHGKDHKCGKEIFFFFFSLIPLISLFSIRPSLKTSQTLQTIDIGIGIKLDGTVQAS